jgi:hypothetical protein
MPSDKDPRISLRLHVRVKKTVDGMTVVFATPMMAARISLEGDVADNIFVDARASRSFD